VHTALMKKHICSLLKQHWASLMAYQCE